MFTVDLLKGQGLPMKSRPTGIIISAAAITVPVIIAMIMLGFYLRNKITISVLMRETARWETETGKFSELVKLQESFEKDRAVYNSCLAEVKSSIGRFAQWSPVLVTVVENMPDSVALTALEAKQRSIRKKVPQKGDPKKTTDVDVPVRTLRVSVCANPQTGSDEAVRNFQARLRSSAFLGPRLENITVSQESGKLEGQDIVTYQIDCVFKPGL
jgi:Tfp pilus assembly protein PilN